MSLRKWLPVREGTTVYQLPIVAVVLAGWYGGRGPGLFASLICCIGVLYWFLPPVNSFVLSSEYQIGFAIFIAFNQPLDRRGAWGAALGVREPAIRRGLQVLAADCGGGTIMSEERVVLR